MRTMTDFTAAAMERFGSSDSAAAMVTISMPPNANATASRPAAMPETPLGRKPDSAMFCVPTNVVPGSRPKNSSTPITMNPMITATLMNANQNSNSPNPRTLTRLTTAKNATQMRPGIHPGMPHQAPMIAPAPVISAPSTMISMNQYSQPRTNPADRPNAISAYVEKAPDAGRAAAISPSMVITRTTMVPAAR